MIETGITTEEDYPKLIALMLESQRASHELFVAMADMAEAVIRENKMLWECLKQYQAGGTKND